MDSLSLFYYDIRSFSAHLGERGSSVKPDKLFINAMVIILDGSSEHGVQIRSKSGSSTC